MLIGNVSGTESIGGLIGGNNDKITVTNCYATGLVTSNDSNFAGGLIGRDTGSNITNCFFDKDTTGQLTGVQNSDNVNVTGCTTASMKMKSVFINAGWDFSTIWSIYETQSYPYLTSNHIEHSISYKNYDGSNITNLKNTIITTYAESAGFTLPVAVPNDDMVGYTFLGYWDSQLDSKNLSFTSGNQITKILETAYGDITVYARYTSDTFNQNVNGREAYIYAPSGVFPNSATATIKILQSGTSDYQALLDQLDNKDSSNIKIIEFDVFDKDGNKIQPNTFFGNATIGIELPESFSADNTSLLRIITGGTDIELTSKIVVDPLTGAKYIEGNTNHFSPYAIVDNSSKATETTGSNTAKTITNNTVNRGIGLYTGDRGVMTVFIVLIISIIVLILLVRYKRVK